MITQRTEQTREYIGRRRKKPGDEATRLKETILSVHQSICPGWVTACFRKCYLMCDNSNPIATGLGFVIVLDGIQILIV